MLWRAVRVVRLWDLMEKKDQVLERSTTPGSSLSPILSSHALPDLAWPPDAPADLVSRGWELEPMKPLWQLLVTACWAPFLVNYSTPTI